MSEGAIWAIVAWTSGGVALATWVLLWLCDRVAERRVQNGQNDVTEEVEGEAAFESTPYVTHHGPRIHQAFRELREELRWAKAEAGKVDVAQAYVKELEEEVDYLKSAVRQRDQRIYQLLSREPLGSKPTLSTMLQNQKVLTKQAEDRCESAARKLDEAMVYMLGGIPKEKVKTARHILRRT